MTKQQAAERLAMRALQAWHNTLGDPAGFEDMDTIPRKRATQAVMKELEILMREIKEGK